MFQRDPDRVAFYHSKAWKATQAAYMASKCHVCERCGRAAKIVHHKRYLTTDNLHDPSVSLSFDNLEALCQECHNHEHFGSRSTAPGLCFDRDGNLVAVGTR